MTRKLPRRDETTVYVTEDGQIAVEQRDPLGNDPAIILLDPADVPRMVEWLQDLVDEAQETRDVNSGTAHGEVRQLR